jgi:hypothetical protein
MMMPTAYFLPLTPAAVFQFIAQSLVTDNAFPLIVGIALNPDSATVASLQVNGKLLGSATLISYLPLLAMGN